MPKKEFILHLEEFERTELLGIVTRGASATWKIQRAQVLLAVDASADGMGWIDARAAEAYHCTTRVVEMWRKQAVLEGPLSLMSRKKRPAARTKLAGDGEARLIALACSQPPDGYGRWNLRLLARRMVELEIVDSISHETVRRELKKTISNLGTR
jgi:hypothetical protein